jgi:hypothetical protein
MNDYPRLKAATMTVLGVVLTALAVLTHADQPAPAAAAHAPAVHVAHAGGTAVSSTLDGGEEPTADADFLVDLFDGATDYTAAQAADLIAIAHRVCDLAQPRADWLASLTAPGPHALTEGEATKLVDTAEAAYCPELSPWNTPRI